jgi:undecaprenyl-diphosphatase
MDLFQAIILGIIQGITEWLPVSSSGHLVIAQQFFGLSVPVIFDVMLHVATLIVVLFVFRTDIWKILRALGKGDLKSPDGKMALFVVVGSIPTALIGFLFHDLFVSFFSSIFVAGVGFIITGFFLFLTRWSKEKQDLGYSSSFLIGIAQGISIIPSISRSGFTISWGLLKGVKRDILIKFSFILSIPAILGAMIYESLNFSGQMELMPLSLAFITSLFVGYISLKALIVIVSKKQLHWFSIYCWIVGIIILVFM